MRKVIRHGRNKAWDAVVVNEELIVVTDRKTGRKKVVIDIHTGEIVSGKASRRFVNQVFGKTKGE